MTEKEKAKAGMLYDANYDKALLDERDRCKSICHTYNDLHPSQLDKRAEVMRSLLGSTGKTFQIEQPFYCDYGYNISIGENFFANMNCVILDGAKVTFGDNVFVAPNCGFYTAGHPLDIDRRNKGLEYAYPITVGNNVWIGANVAVLPGVTIGDGAVIGAGSVVTSNIPAGVLAAGNPCRVIKKIDQHPTSKPVEMEDLVNLLHKKGCSCVIADSRNELTFCYRRGVIDLFEILKHSPETLNEALVADKVVGKGAAALMVLGRIKALHTDVISKPALEMLRQYGIEPAYDTLVDNIINRTGTGICPVEQLTSNVATAEEALPLIEQFIAKMKN